jgi:hypothetical protein
MKINELLKEDLASQEPGEYDQEGDMAQRQLLTAKDAADELRSILTADENLPEWVQQKIAMAVDYLDTARDYMKSTKQQNNDNSVANEETVQFDIIEKLKKITGIKNKEVVADLFRQGLYYEKKINGLDQNAHETRNIVFNNIAKKPNHYNKLLSSLKEEKQKGVDGKVCWDGYKRMGTKMKGGKRVDNCVPIKGKK